MALRPAQLAEAQHVAPAHLALRVVRDAAAEQRVARVGALPVVARDARLLPIDAVVVPGVGRQVLEQLGGLGRSALGPKGLPEPGEADVVGAEVAPERPDRLPEGLDVAGAALERADVGWGRRGIAQYLLQSLLGRAAERRVRAHLDGQVERPLILDRRLDGRREENRLDHVLDPVRALQRLQVAVEEPRVSPDARDPQATVLGRLHTYVARLERLEIALHAPVHMMRVIRRVHLQQPRKDGFLVKVPLRLLDGLEIPRQRHALGRIARRHAQPARVRGLLAKGPRLVVADADRQHPAGLAPRAARQVGVLAAVVGDLHGGGRVDEAAGVGGGDLARGVADDGAEADAARAQHLEEAELEGGADRLRDLGLAHARARVVAAQLVDQRPRGAVRQGLQHLVAARQDAAEQGRPVEQGAAHGGPLGALAGEDAEEARGGVEGAAADADVVLAGGLAVLREESLQVLDEPLAGLGGEECSHAMRGASVLEDPAQIGQVDRRILRQVLQEALAVAEKGRGRVRRENKGAQVPRWPARFGRRYHPVAMLGLVVLDNGMGIGAPEAEAVDAGAHGRSGGQLGPGQGSGRDLEPAVVRRDLRVELGEQQVGEDGAVLDGEQRLQDPGQAGTPLQVPDQRLDGPDVERGGRLRGLGVPVPDHGFVDGPRLDRISRGGSRAVALEVLAPVLDGVQAGALVRLADEGRLGSHGGHRQPGALPVRVHPGAADDPFDGVVVPERLVERLQHHDGGAFAARVAVDRLVPHPGLGVGREHVQLGQHDVQHGVEDEVDPAHDGAAGIARLEPLYGLVQRHQGAGAGRVERDRRSVEVKRIGDTVGQDTPSHAGTRV